MPVACYGRRTFLSITLFALVITISSSFSVEDVTFICLYANEFTVTSYRKLYVKPDFLHQRYELQLAEHRKLQIAITFFFTLKRNLDSERQTDRQTDRKVG